jgi:hypothetical protein
MANTKKIYRYKAGATGSSVEAENEDVQTEKVGMFLSGSNYLLGRLPFTKNEFEHWSNTKRLLVGYLLWLLVLPVWPLVIIAVLWSNTKLLRRGLIFTVLGALAVLWFWSILSLLGVLR